MIISITLTANAFENVCTSQVSIWLASDAKLMVNNVFNLLRFIPLYLSMSGTIRSIVAIMATRSPILQPVAIVSNADKFEKFGERYFIL